MTMTAEEIIDAIKTSALGETELAAIMNATVTKVMANAFVAGGLDMMSDPSIWGQPETVSTGTMPGACGAHGEGRARGAVCARDEGHPYNGTTALHRGKNGELW